MYIWLKARNQEDLNEEGKWLQMKLKKTRKDRARMSNRMNNGSTVQDNEVNSESSHEVVMSEPEAPGDFQYESNSEMSSITCPEVSYAEMEVTV